MVNLEAAMPRSTASGCITRSTAPDAEGFILHVKDLIRPRTSKQAKVEL
jgi:hypothetical protein